MGLKFMDGYSYLHFAVGIVMYYWNINLVASTVLHTIFEFLENTDDGMKFINKYIKIWPGGKSYRDSFINNVGDTMFFVVGWLSAYLMNEHLLSY